MNKQQQQQKQPITNFQDLVKIKKLKFQKDQRVLDRYLKNKIKINIDPPTIENRSIKHKVAESLDSPYMQKNSNWSKRISTQFDELRGEHILLQNAKNFIQRIKKQKEYNKGRYLILRKREQQKREDQKRKIQQISQEYYQSYHYRRRQEAMMNIALHESRVNYRANQSLERSMKRSNVRSHTSVNQSRQINQSPLEKRETPQILPRKRLTSILQGND